jgi:hypothetical protein
MAMTPTARRKNFIRLHCVELIRSTWPNLYAQVVAEAEAKFPKQQQGRPRGVVETSPRMTRRRQSIALQTK